MKNLLLITLTSVLSALSMSAQAVTSQSYNDPRQTSYQIDVYSAHQWCVDKGALWGQVDSWVGVVFTSQYGPYMRYDDSTNSWIFDFSDYDSSQGYEEVIIATSVTCHFE